jgi:hypothetical protein
VGELQLADFQERDLFVVDEEHLLADRRDVTVFELDVLRDASETHFVIFIARRIPSESWEEDFAEFHHLESGPGADERGNPQKVTDPLGRFALNGFDVLEWYPDVGTGGIGLQARTNARIGVGEHGELLAVERTFDRSVGVAGMCWVVVLVEEFLAGLFGMEGGAVENRA